MSISIVFIKHRRFALDGKTYQCRKIAFNEHGFWVDDRLEDLTNIISRIGGFTIDASHVEQIDAKDVSLHFKKNIQHLHLEQKCNVSIAGDVSILNTKGGFVNCNSAVSVLTQFANVVNPCSAFALVYNSLQFQRKSQHQISFEGDVGKVYASNCNMVIGGSVMSIYGKSSSLSLSVFGIVNLLEMNDAGFQEDGSSTDIVTVGRVGSVKTRSGNVSLRFAREAFSTYGKTFIQENCDQQQASSQSCPPQQTPVSSVFHSFPTSNVLCPPISVISSEPNIQSVQNLPNISSDESGDSTDYLVDDYDDNIDLHNDNHNPHHEASHGLEKSGFENLTCDALFGDAAREVVFQRKVVKALFGPLYRPLTEHLDVTHQIGDCVELHTGSGQLSEFFGRPFPTEYCHLQVWYFK